MKRLIFEYIQMMSERIATQVHCTPSHEPQLYAVVPELWIPNTGAGDGTAAGILRD
jgi:hypothetical protein